MMAQLVPSSFSRVALCGSLQGAVPITEESVFVVVVLGKEVEVTAG